MNTARPTVAISKTIVLWIAIQLAALLVSISGFAFWRQTGDVDRNALAVFVTIDLVVAALLATKLTESWQNAAIVIVSTVAFAQIAAAIAAVPGEIIFRTILALVVWLIALATWISLARGELARSIACALASAITIGGVVLLYVREEFAAQSGSTSSALFGPISAIVTLANNAAKLSDVHAAWGFVVIACAAGAIAATISAWSRGKSSR